MPRQVEDTAVSLAIDGLRGAILNLGLADAATPLGALELVARELQGIAEAIDRHAEAVVAVAEAIKSRVK